MMKNKYKTVAAFLCGMLFTTFSWVQSAKANIPEKAVSPVILTITDQASKDFTLAELQALPQKTVVTTTPWTDGSHSYTGVLLRDLLDKVGLQHAVKLKATALNDYVTTLAVADAYKYNVLLALSQDGKLMSRRNKGPIWVIYPLTEHPELDKPTYHSAMIWQLRSISVSHE
jgi:Uncharacterized protein conserved in bacteria